MPNDLDSSSPSQLKSFVHSLIFRIDNNYYDLTKFSEEHPGGKNILIYAKRKSWDHTQMFAIHHVNYTKAVAIMKKYLIKDESLIQRIHELEALEIPQYFPKQLPHSTSEFYPKLLKGSGFECEYTVPFGTDIDSIKYGKYSFNDLKMADCVFKLPKQGSFYWELREEIYKYFKKNNLSYYPTSFYMIAWWFVAFLSLFSQIMNGLYYQSKLIAIFTGLTYLFMGGYGHQFIHNPVLFRKYAYLSLDWIGLYSYAYMVDHSIVHHIFTNTIPDNHFDGTDPFLMVNPFIPRNKFRKMFNFLIANITLFSGVYGNYLFNVANIITGKEPFYVSIFIFPANYILMCCLCRDIFTGLILSVIHTLIVSIWYFTIALMNHNQSENWNMDKLTEAANKSDGSGWAEMQLVTSSDIGYNYGFIGSMLCLWLNYHTVHHLLPTVDMSHHQQAQKILNKISKKHGLSYSYKSPWTMYWDMLETFSVARAFNVMLDT